MRYAILLGALCVPIPTFAADFPKFTTQEIDTGLSIGYAVIVEDIDGDQKPDIIVVDQHKVVWYKNPGPPGAAWKKYTLLDGKTRPDNVCITALDITGDGKPELVLGAAWKPADTTTNGQLVWLQRGPDVTQEWSMHELPCDEPSIHRIRAIDIDGNGKPEIVHVPLQGRGASAKGNFTDGKPVRIIAMKVPAKEPEKKENWKPIVLSEQLHVCHNFYPGPDGGWARKGRSILVASYEGVSLVYPDGPDDAWTTRTLHEGHQANPQGPRGASEIKHSHDGRGLIATIEPWHGHQVVVYTPGKPHPDKPFPLERHVIDEQLRWGHAVWFADLDDDGRDELIIGVRDDPNPKAGDKHTQRRGVRIYRSIDARGTTWDRALVDEGGVAVEDLTVADLDGDGRPDIIAVGRQTKNVRIYWNQGK